MSPKRVKQLDLYLGLGCAAGGGGGAGPRATDKIGAWPPHAISTLVREMRDAYNHRLRLVQSARQHGIKPTARAFVTTVPTVRKWLRRFQTARALWAARTQPRPSALPTQDLCRDRANSPGAAPEAAHFGSGPFETRVRSPRFAMAIQRIWREHGLLRKRKKKYKRKQDLAAVKATWRLFQQISADAKEFV